LRAQIQAVAAREVVAPAPEVVAPAAVAPAAVAPAAVALGAVALGAVAPEAVALGAVAAVVLAAVRPVVPAVVPGLELVLVPALVSAPAELALELALVPVLVLAELESGLASVPAELGWGLVLALVDERAGKPAR